MTGVGESVAAAEVIRNFGFWQQQALQKPLVVTHHGRARVMLISTEHFEALTSGDDAVPAYDNGDLLRSVLMHTAEGFMVVDAELLVQDANNVALDWLGVTLDDIRGKPANQLGPSANHVFGSMLRRVFRSGEAVSYEINSSASGRRLSVRSFPFGELVASVFADISEQEALRDGANRLEATTLGLDLLDTVATVEVDGDGRIAQSSATLERMTSLHAEHLKGIKLADLVDAADRPVVAGALAAAMAERRSSRVDAALLARGSSRKTISISVAPLERGLTVKGAIAAIALRQAPSTDAERSQLSLARPVGQ
jgi:PAS domain-containing protein